MLYEQPDETEGGDGRRDHEGRAEFAPEDAEDVLRGEFLQSERADHQARGLTAGVAAGIHQHRHEGDEDREVSEDRFALQAVKDHRGEGA